MSDKPPILQDQEFTIEEGFLYRAFRTGAIWMNKLFFSSLFLLAVWLVMGYLAGVEDCASSPKVVETANGTVDEGEGLTCSVILTPTAKYLGAMSVVSFVLSIGFGMLGLVVGKRIVEATPARQEPGAPDRDASGGDGAPGPVAGGQRASSPEAEEGTASGPQPGESEAQRSQQDRASGGPPSPPGEEERPR